MPGTIGIFPSVIKMHTSPPISFNTYNGILNIIISSKVAYFLWFLVNFGNLFFISSSTMHRFMHVQRSSFYHLLDGHHTVSIQRGYVCALYNNIYFLCSIFCLYISRSLHYAWLKLTPLFKKNTKKHAYVI